jgi:hypothetical protein
MSPFKPKQPQPDFEALKAILNVSDTQTKNNPLYQTLIELLERITRFKSMVNINIDDIINGDVVLTLDHDFLTHTDESVDLPNSRQLLAGDGIVFDDTIDNERTISSAGGDHVLLSDGTTPIPFPVHDGFGNFIYVAYTP